MTDCVSFGTITGDLIGLNISGEITIVGLTGTPNAIRVVIFTSAGQFAEKPFKVRIDC